LSALGQRYETSLPAQRNLRTLALARELRGRAADDADYARIALRWFAEAGLLYSLEPEPTSIDSVDSVLFDTRRGFCGHFASAYATLMRAAGVPARVVTGYLGGEWNPIGGYLIVRQSDAHAWTEIWLDGQGWTRVDPTVVVAPERLRAGAYDALPASQASTAVSLYRSAWLNRIVRLWDGTNHWWREQVLEFDMRSQLAFLQALGIEAPDWRHLGWGFAAALVAWIAWVSVALRRGVARRKPDRIGRAWLRLARKLERVAPARAASEGPLDFARRIGAAQPELATAVSAIAARYARLRYGRDADPADVEALEREVRALKMGTLPIS
jgi:hypothetical protein